MFSPKKSSSAHLRQLVIMHGRGGNNGPFRLHVCCKDTICVVAYYRKTERTKTIKTAQDKNRFLSIPNMWNVAII